MAFTTLVLIVTYMTITTAAIFGDAQNNEFPRFMPRMRRMPDMMPKFEMPKFEHKPFMPHFGPEDFMPHIGRENFMPHIGRENFIPPMLPINPDLIRAHVAAGNEKYSGSSFTSYSHTSIKDGKKTFDGSVSSLDNDGHHVNEKVYSFKG